MFIGSWTSHLQSPLGPSTIWRRTINFKRICIQPFKKIMHWCKDTFLKLSSPTTYWLYYQIHTFSGVNYINLLYCFSEAWQGEFSTFFPHCNLWLFCVICMYLLLIIAMLHLAVRCWEYANLSGGGCHHDITLKKVFFLVICNKLNGLNIK